MKCIKDKKFDEERALYALNEATIFNCIFAGPKDGESVLKECKNIKIKDSTFDLRYPIWHADNIEITNCIFKINSRAAFWYDKKMSIKSLDFKSVKPFRECSDSKIFDSKIIGIEPFWRCKKFKISNTKVKGVYPFFECDDFVLENVYMEGKYSIQYNHNLKVNNCKFKTKDAFWHSEDVVVKDSILIGEYIAWFSKNLTLINCKIVSHQPFCYCENLKLINCEMVDCDLAFEYSSIDAEVTTKIDSIKNVKSGILRAPEIGEIINTEDSKVKSKLKILKN